MKASLVLKLIGVAVLVLMVNVICSILYMVVYGHVINPGHEAKFYEDHIQIAGPYCSIVAGMPIMLLTGWWVAGFDGKMHGILPVIVVWAAYTLIDLSVLIAAGMSVEVGVLFLVSFATKLVSGYCGARYRLRQPGSHATI